LPESVAMVLVDVRSPLGSRAAATYQVLTLPTLLVLHEKDVILRQAGRIDRQAVMETIATLTGP